CLEQKDVQAILSSATPRAGENPRNAPHLKPNYAKTHILKPITGDVVCNPCIPTTHGRTSPHPFKRAFVVPNITERYQGVRRHILKKDFKKRF
ncbi:MAG: hypothetical protein LBU70_05735, partial [Chitinispirillales bacterium]|nr:hypothetical protein [Chitinispirillales bacterium]